MLQPDAQETDKWSNDIHHNLCTFKQRSFIG